MYRYALLIILLLLSSITQAQSVDLPEELEGIKIAFEGIRIYDLDGTNRVDVLFDEELPITLNSQPVWSFDGQQIVFVYRQSDLFVVEPDGSNLRQITNTRSKHRLPTWSPNNQYILFIGEDGRYIVDIKSQQQTLIPDYASSQYWLPNSQLVFFDKQHLFVVQVEKLNIIRQIDFDEFENIGNARFHAGWSPDGQYLLYMIGDPEQWDLYKVSLDTGDLLQLTDHNANDFRPAWSPDNQRITFLSNREGDYSLYVMNADGSQVIKLADNVREDRYSQGSEWSSDGEYIAFVDSDNINIVNVNTQISFNAIQYNIYDSTGIRINEIRWHPSSRGILVDVHYFNVVLTEPPYSDMGSFSEFRWVDLKCLDTEIGCTPEIIKELMIPSPIPESEDYSISPFITGE